MNSDLTQFEFRILEATLKQHTVSVAFDGLDIAKLKVVRREASGVGVYILLSREDQGPRRTGICHQLGFTGEIEVPGVPSGLGAVIDIESGQLNHIELFTYGNETWDGDTSQGTVTPESPLS